MASIVGSRVLVTGGSGLIGSHTVEALLADGVGQVVVFDNFINESNLGSVLGRPEVQIIQGDLNDHDSLGKAMDGVDYLIHQAGLLFLPSTQNPRKSMLVNINGTFDLIELALNKGVKKLIYASSISLYGTPKTDQPVSEDGQFLNRTIYGASKIAGEQFCRVFRDLRGLDYLAMRYSSVYGPRQHMEGTYPRLIMNTLAAIKENRTPLIEGTGNEVQDLIYVEDAARANVLALKSDYSDEAYNIVSGIPVTVREILETVLRLQRSELKIEFQPQEGKGLISRRTFSGAKAERDLGFKPSVSLEEGLSRMIAWAQSVGKA